MKTLIITFFVLWSLVALFTAGPEAFVFTAVASWIIYIALRGFAHWLQAPAKSKDDVRIPREYRR